VFGGEAIGKVQAPARLVDALLREAGVAGSWSYRGVASAGRVNTTTAIETGSGRWFAVRVYGWPFGGEPRFDRRAKEVAWSTRLAAAGVPVARFLAVADVDAETDAEIDVEGAPASPAPPVSGALVEWIDGELLGTVAAREPREDLTDAWRGAGAALRTAHGVDPGVVGEGFLSADGLVAFDEGTFAAWIVHRTAAHARRLHGTGDGVLDPARVEALAPALEARLGRAPSGLGHGDSNPWNALIARDGTGGWAFRAWLDWEFAWVADPAYDHVRASVQRYADIGPTPDSWWEGYGGRPEPVAFAAHTIHYALWKAEERLDGLDSPETRLAARLLPSLPARLDRLAAALAS